ncbi:MAG: hypothetical protein KA149_06250 [Chitinophagales bacterium]|nr:hypothetical protein [Chitinophagales bacterium]
MKKLVVAYILFFLLLRVPVYYFFNCPYWGGDAMTYLLHTRENGLFIFDTRLPVYVLFVEFIARLTNSLAGIAIFQSVFSLGVSLGYLATAYRHYRNHFLFHLLFIALCYCNYYTIFYEVSIFSEAVYFNLLLLFFMWSRLAFDTGLKKYWLRSGIMLLVLLLTKQAAIFMLPLVALAAGYLLYKKMYGQARLFVLPSLAGVLLFCSYNYISLGKFAYSPFGGFNLVGTTIMYMHTSPKYPAEVNNCIANVKQQIPADEIEIINRSFNPLALQRVFHNHYNDCHKLMVCILNEPTSQKRIHLSPMAEYESIYYDISLTAIRQHPAIYFKFVGTMLLNYFVASGFSLVTKMEISAEEKREYYDNLNQHFCKPGLSSTFCKLKEDTQRSSFNVVPSGGELAFWQYIILVLNKISYSILWPAAQFVFLVFIIWKVAIKKLPLQVAAIFAALIASNILHAIGTSLVEETFIRYSYPFFYSYYYLVVAIPFLYSYLKEEY